MKTFFLAGGLSLLAVAGAEPATAQNAHSLIIQQVKVSHGDLDLTTEQGAETMLARLSGAASAACGRKPRTGVGDPLGPSKQRIYRLCVVAAIDNATLQLNAPLVRTAWLEDDDAIKFGTEARRTSSELFKLASANPGVRLQK